MSKLKQSTTFIALVGLVAVLWLGIARAAAPADVPDVEWERLENGPDRALHTMIYDPVHEIFWSFGGILIGTTGTSTFNTVYRLDATDPDAEWQLIRAGGLPIPPLALHSATYDPLRQRLVVFGGTKTSNIRSQA